MLFGKKFMIENEAGEGGSGGGSAGDDKNKGGSGNPPAGDSGNAGDKGPGDDSASGKFDLSSLPKEAQDMIKSLRTENAKHRTEKNALSSRMEKLEKGFKTMFGEGEAEEDAEKLLPKIQSEREALSVRNAMYELALEHGIGKDDFEFFEFKMSKKLNSLEEGEELTEDGLGEILASLPSRGSAKGTGKQPANSSAGAGGKPPQGGSGDEVTLEQFTKMGMLEKSALYTSKPDTYNKLMAESKQKKLL